MVAGSVIRQVIESDDYRREDKSERVSVSKTPYYYVCVGDLVAAEVWPREYAEAIAKAIRRGETLREAMETKDWTTDD